LQNTGGTVAQLELLTEAERRQLLAEWNETRADYPRDRCVHELFAARAASAPGSVAVTYEDERLTYAELDARANQLAHRLRKLGVGPESLVAVSIERSLEMVVGVLGVLKAGGAYVPLDPSYPRERLAYILESARPQVLLTQRHLAEALPRHEGETLCLDARWEAIAGEETCEPSSGVTVANQAYVIFTSGSTGRPKGVQVVHRGLANLAVAQARAFGVRAGDRVLQFSSLSFDASIFEIMMALASGATLCLGPHQSLLVGQ
jgi:non-ribosomal peptide synthetase component F